MLSPKETAKHYAPFLQLKKKVNPKIDLDAKTHGIFMTFHVVTSAASVKGGFLVSADIISIKVVFGNEQPQRHGQSPLDKRVMHI